MSRRADGKAKKGRKGGASAAAAAAKCAEALGWMQQLIDLASYTTPTSSESKPLSESQSTAASSSVQASGSASSDKSTCDLLLEQIHEVLKEDEERHHWSDEDSLLHQLCELKGTGRTLMHFCRQGKTYAGGVLSYLLKDRDDLSFQYSLVYEENAFRILNETLIADPVENGEMVIIVANELILDRREMTCAALQSGLFDTMISLMAEPDKLALPVFSRAGEFFANMALIRYSCERTCEEQDQAFLEKMQEDYEFLEENRSTLSSLLSEVLPVADLANIILDYMPNALVSEEEIELICTRVLTGPTMKAALAHPMTTLFYACRLPERIFSWFEEEEEEGEEDEEDEESTDENSEEAKDGEEAKETEEDEKVEEAAGERHRLSKMMQSWARSGYLPLWLEQIQFSDEEIHWCVARHIEIMCHLPSLPAGDDSQEEPAFNPIDALVEAKVLPLMMETLTRCSVSAGHHMLRSLAVIFQADSSKHLLAMKGPELNSNMKNLMDGILAFIRNDDFRIGFESTNIIMQLCAVLAKAPVPILDKLVKHRLIDVILDLGYFEGGDDETGESRLSQPGSGYS